jgi:hypothetical protein
MYIRDAEPGDPFLPVSKGTMRSNKNENNVTQKSFFAVPVYQYSASIVPFFALPASSCEGNKVDILDPLSLV